MDTNSRHTHSPPNSFLKQVWVRLTTPHHSLDQLEQRQRAYLTSAILVVIIPLFIIPEFIRILSLGYITAFFLPTSTLLVLAYGLSRTRHYQVGIVIFLATFTVMPIISAVSQQYTPDNLFAALVWILPTVIIGSLLLSVRGTAVFILINLTLPLLLLVLIPGTTLSHLLLPSGFILAISIPLLVATAIRQNDIEQLKIQSDKLARSAKQFRSLAEHSHAAIFLIEDDYRLMYVNGNVCSLTGYTREELTGQDFRFLLDEASCELVTDRYRRRKAGEQVPTQYEFSIVHKNGEKRLVEISAATYTNSQGHLQIIAQLLDITERKKTEAALRDSEALYQSLVNSLPQNIFRKDVDGRFTFANEHFCKTQGKPLSEIIGKTDFDLHPSDATHKYRADDRRVMETGETLETLEAFVLLNGKTSYIQTVKTPTYDAEGRLTGIQGIFWDITDMRQAQEALRQSAAKNRALSKSTFEALFFSENGVCIECNQSAVDMFGYTYDELIGIFGTDVIAEESKERVKKNMLSGYEKPYEALAQRKDGSTFPAEFQGKMYEYEGRMVRVTAVRDITERKQAQEALQSAYDDLEERVQQRTQELATANIRLKELDRHKDKFIEDMSHELRTPLANLALYLDLLELSKEAEKQTKYMNALRYATERLTHLSENILTVTRLNLYKDNIRPTPLELNKIIANVIQQHQQTADKADLQLIFTPDASLPPVLAERAHIYEIITRLLNNSLNYTPAGQIEVSASFDETRQQVCLQVSDTGFGIEEEDLPFLFDRFYRGQHVGQFNIPGSGLGLAVVKEIVELYGGRVDVESQKGQGSTFRVWLPAAAE